MPYTPLPGAGDPFLDLVQSSGAALRKRRDANLKAMELGNSSLARSDQAVNDQREKIRTQVKDLVVKTGSSL